MGADGQGRWLIAVEGAGGELDDLRLAIGERRHALLTAPARDALVTPATLGVALRETIADPRAREQALALLRGAAQATDGGAAAATLHAMREALRTPLPATVIDRHATCVVRLERVGAIDDRAFWLTGWIHEPAPERVALTIVTPEGDRLAVAPGRITWHPRADVESAFPDGGAPSLGFHVYLELEAPSHHPNGWVLEARTASGEAVEDVQRNAIERDAARLRHRILDPLRVPQPSPDALAGQVLPALERLRAGEPAAVDAISEHGPPVPAPHTTVLVATARADLVVHHLLSFAGAEGVELLFVVVPGIAAAVTRHAPALGDLYGVGFRVACLTAPCGLAEAINLGTGLARGTRLVLLRDDVFADSPEWLGELARVQDAEGAAAIGPRLVFEDGAVADVGVRLRPGEGQPHWEVERPLRGLAAELPATRRSGPVQALAHGCVMVDAEWLRARGGLCESYLDGGDPVTDLSLELGREGAVIWSAGELSLTDLGHGGWPARVSPATRRFNDWLLDLRHGDALRGGAPDEDRPAGATAPVGGSAPVGATAPVGERTVTIDAVTAPAQLPSWLAEATVTHPGSGSELAAYDGTFSLAIEGWAVAAQGTGLSVEVTHAGVPLARTPVDVARKDVAQRRPELPGAAAAGFATVLGTVGLPARFTVEVEVVRDEDGERALVAQITGRRALLRPRRSSRMMPLLLTTLGRTGSSWLELLVGCHPEIVACRPFVHDARLTSYWTQVLRTFAEPASYLQILRPELYPGPWWTGEHRPGRLPLRMAETHMAHWLGDDGVRAAADLCQERIDRFYGELARVEERPRARYFAEKCWPDDFTTGIVSELYPGGREILLVRDFRDMFCSILGFNAKRGTTSFGRESVDSDEQFIVALRDSALQMRAAWRARRQSAHLMRYEDLILAPDETLTRACEYLGVDADEATVSRVLADAAAQLPDAQRDHRTAASPAESIGRWRGELSGERRALCHQAFDDVLVEFGYAPTGPAGGDERPEA
jgi:hypothetical protein